MEKGIGDSYDQFGQQRFTATSRNRTTGSAGGAGKFRTSEAASPSRGHRAAKQRL